MKQLTCSCCKETKDETEFNRDTKSKTGRQYKCKDCRDEITQVSMITLPAIAWIERIDAKYGVFK